MEITYAYENTKPIARPTKRQNTRQGKDSTQETARNIHLPSRGILQKPQSTENRDERRRFYATDFPTHLLSWKSGNRRNSPFLLHRTTAAESAVEQWSAAARSRLTPTSDGSTEKRKSGANDGERAAKLMPERNRKKKVVIWIALTVCNDVS